LNFSDAVFDGYSSLSSSRKTSATEAKLEECTPGQNQMLGVGIYTNRPHAAAEEWKPDTHYSRSNAIYSDTNNSFHASINTQYEAPNTDGLYPRTAAASDKVLGTNCQLGSAETDTARDSSYFGLSPTQGSISNFGACSDD